MQPTNSFKDLIVWRKSMELVFEIYKITQQFPTEEKYGLVSQMRRSAVSIPSNIAEGRSRGTKKDYLNFLRIAYGSGAELETQILIAKKLQLTTSTYQAIEQLHTETMKMLNAMIKKMSTKARV